jgi:hypothetical protein
MSSIQNQEELRRRAEHHLAVFVLVCLVVSLLAGFIAYEIGGYSVGSFVGAGLLCGIVVGVALFGRKAGVFRRGSGIAPRPAYRYAGWVLGVLFLAGGAVLVAGWGVHGNPTALWTGLNMAATGALFVLFCRMPKEAQPIAAPNGGPATQHGNSEDTEGRHR